MRIGPLGLGMALLYFALTPVLQARLVRVGPMSLVGAIGVIALTLLGVEFAARPRLANARGWWLPVLVFCGSLALGLLQGPDYAAGSSGAAIASFLVPAGIVSLLMGRLSRMVKVGLATVAGLLLAALLQIYGEMAFGDALRSAQYDTLSRSFHAAQDWQTGAQLGIQSAFGCLAMSICAVGCVAFAVNVRRPRLRWVAGAVAVVLLVGQSRGGYGVSALVAALGVAGALVWGRRRVAQVGAPIVLGMFVAIATFGAARLGYLGIGNLAYRIDRIHAEGVFADPSIAVRWESVTTSVKAFLSNPITGIGMQGWFMDRDSPIGGHSSLVDVPAQLGVVGFLAYYGLFVGGAVRAFRVFSSSRPRDLRRPVACGVGIALLAFLFASALDPVFLQPILNELSLCLVGLSVALQIDRRGLAPAFPRGDPGRRAGEMSVSPAVGRELGA